MFFDRLTNYDEKVNVESLIGSSKIWYSNIQMNASYFQILNQGCYLPALVSFYLHQLLLQLMHW